MSEDTASGAAVAATDAASDKKAGDQTTTTTTAAADTKGADKGTTADAGKGKTTTAVDAAATDTTTAAAPAAFPEDWRKQLSKGDEKAMKRLERYASPVAIAEALINAQDRIAKGIKPGLPEGATEEQVKEYRALIGVPEKPEDYKVELADGYVIGDDDKPLVDHFLKSAHAANMPPAAVNAMLNSYYATQDLAREMREDADIDQDAARKQALQEEFGTEYRGTMNNVANMLAAAPAGVKEALKGARAADGTLLLNDISTARWLAYTAKALNSAATVAPGSSANAAQTVTDELNSLKADMANSDSDYHKAPMIVRNGIKDTPKAHRYRELVEAQERLQAAGKVAKAA